MLEGTLLLLGHERGLLLLGHEGGLLLRWRIL